MGEVSITHFVFRKVPEAVRFSVFRSSAMTAKTANGSLTNLLLTFAGEWGELGPEF